MPTDGELVKRLLEALKDELRETEKKLQQDAQELQRVKEQIEELAKKAKTSTYG